MASDEELYENNNFVPREEGIPEIAPRISLNEQPM